MNFFGTQFAPRSQTVSTYSRPSSWLDLCYLSGTCMWIEFLSMLPSTIYLIAKGFRPQAKLYFDTPFFKFVAVFLGVGVIAVVMIWD